MTAVNYDKEMIRIISSLNSEGEKPRLLLHSCCAPCSTSCIERLKEAFDLTVYYYNPNIDTKDEFLLRALEQKKYCGLVGVKYIEEEYLKAEFLETVKGLEALPEGGDRCAKCFYLRLKRTAEKAKSDGYDYFTTTLTVSPLKNAERINGVGKLIEKETGVKFLPTDFKKRGGYLRSTELSREYGLYRQNYCGCEFSRPKE